MKWQFLFRDDVLLSRTNAERIGVLVMHPFKIFAKREASGSFLLLFCAMLALLWANSQWATTYEQILHTPFGISAGEQLLRLDLRQWINDGLMSIFFFGVGLEIKREFLVGRLAERKKAMLPIAAAFGGMVVPALFYTAFNFGGGGIYGWGIPMATDIAFALGALAVLGSRIQDGLKVFLVALAIIDDLGALLVIAIFYTVSINWIGIAFAGACLGALFVANLTGARRGHIYLLLGVILWGSLFYSGLHATLAGVLTAFLIPARTRIAPPDLPHFIHRSFAVLNAQVIGNATDTMDANRFSTINGLSRTLDAATSPLQRFEHMVKPWVTFGVLPIFALLNAGVAINKPGLYGLLSAVPMGIIFGLVIGKPLGIIVASWLAVKSGLATLPDGVSWRHLLGTGFLAGIGFTMALFIGGLAFTGTPFESQAKLAIIIGSLLSALAGIAILLSTKPANPKLNQPYKE